MVPEAVKVIKAAAAKTGLEVEWQSLPIGRKAHETHGPAPDIAGGNIANPYAMIMSGQILLEWLSRKRGEPRALEAARLIEKAVDQVIAEAKHLTGDLGGKAGTTQMGDAIAAAI